MVIKVYTLQQSLLIFKFQVFVLFLVNRLPGEPATEF